MTSELSPECREALKAAQRMIHQERSLGHYIEDAPGKEALKIYPQLLSELSAGVHSIVVTGTNGKTTCCRLISSILAEAGMDHFTNREGANMSGRIATLFAENYNPESGPRKRQAVLECDEAYLRYVIPEIQPDILVITNIYPDQKERFGSEEHVAELILTAMRNTRPAVCIMAADCHWKDRIQSLPGWKYIEYCVTDGSIQTAGHTYAPTMKIPGAFNLLNAAAAAHCAEKLGIPAEVILRGIENTNPAFGRMETFRYEGHTILLTLAKNAAGFAAVSDYILNERGKESPCSSREDTWIVAMNRNTGDDLDTEWLSENRYADAAHFFQHILVTGDCAEIVLSHMIGEGVDADAFLMENIAKAITEAKGSVVITANYTAMLTIRRTFAEIGVIQPYWED